MSKDNTVVTSEKENEVLISLVGNRQAKEGFVFLHHGSIEECKDCKLFKICLAKLESGRIYEIVGIRDKNFKCKIHDEGVRVVELRKADTEASIEKRLAFEGVTITYKQQECQDSSCLDYKACTPLGLKNGDKCKVIKIGDLIKCPREKSLVRVTLRPFSEDSLS
jgi:uncharacterized protein (UPF0179 family)